MDLTDSLGKIQPLEHLSDLPSKFQLPEKIKRTDILRYFARLAVVYGDDRIADSRRQSLLAKEWHEALIFYEPSLVETAISNCIRKLKFWPTIAELLDEVKANFRPPQTSYSEKYLAAPSNSIIEDMGKRAADCLRFREQYGFGKSQDLLEPKPEPKPASQEITISFELMNSKAVKNLKGNMK